MKHISDPDLMGYLDGEASPAYAGEITTHLQSCPRCQAAVTALRARREKVSGLLASTESDLQRIPPVSTARAWKRLGAFQDQPQKEKWNMAPRLFTRRSRPAWIALGVVLVIALSMAVPSVRALAADLLRSFRVQQIAVIPINPANLPEDINQFGPRIDQLLSENAQYEVLGEPQTAADAAEAFNELRTWQTPADDPKPIRCCTPAPL